VKVLLDTQVWLWMLAAPDRLSERSRALVTSPDTELVLSAVSTWEIAIKHSLGKLVLPEPTAAYVARLMTSTGVVPLPIYHRHTLHVATLPAHHADPFDRLLVAQAQLEELPVLTADAMLRSYDVQTIAA
jgi:PIN domain nuclease of toxin-antitoxin system